MKQNYQRLFDQTILQLQEQGRVPRLLLHAVRPAVLMSWEYLSAYFLITVFYYNPNIYPDEEYNKRVAEQKAFIERFPVKHPISFVEGDFDKERFYEVTKGLEKEPEGGKRCQQCFRLRLEETAKLAKEMQMDYFTTTLSISPMKNAQMNTCFGKASNITAP